MNAAVEIDSAGELAELLAARPPRHVRLCGTGSRQHGLPPPPPDTVALSLRRLSAIERFEPDDLTCSVQAGLPRRELDAALLPHRLELACAGQGSLGGLFAADPIGALTAGGPAPRSLLLGMDAVLASGQAFKSGARVVKSVAGFDLHKLFVGSRGLLFAATTLHLRLRPRPRASAAFCCAGLDADAAVQQFQQLRLLPVPPARLQLRRDGDGCRVSGRIAGRASFVTATLRTLALPEVDGDGDGDAALQPRAGEALLHGMLRPSRLPQLLQQLPAAARLLVHGSGRFEVAVPAAATTALLQALPVLGAHAAVAGGDGALLGRGTALDPGAERLQRQLKDALDPAGVLV